MDAEVGRVAVATLPTSASRDRENANALPPRRLNTQRSHHPYWACRWSVPAMAVRMVVSATMFFMR